MDWAKAKKIWEQAFATKYSDERAPLLRRLLAASPKDVVALARKGRRRYDRDAGSELRGRAWLMAGSRKKNTLMDVVQIRLGYGRRASKLGDINTYSELTLAHVPFGMFVECYSMGGSFDPNGGKQPFLGYPGTGRYITELASAIPRLKTYKAFGINVRCYWTAKEALAGFKDWLSQIRSPDPPILKEALVSQSPFPKADLSEEARAVLREKARAPLFAALANGDPPTRRGTYQALRALGIEFA